MKYKTGQIILGFKNHPECTQFDVSDNGAIMLIFLNEPTENEKKQFSEKKSFEIRFVEINNVIMISTKIGDFNWMDAPYNSHLSKNLTKFKTSNNETFMLTLMLIDSSTGRIECIKLINLSDKFINELFTAANKQKKENFNLQDYDRNIKKIYNMYTSEQIANISHY